MNYTVDEVLDDEKATAMVDALVALATAHMRVLTPDATEQTLIRQYVRAAIAAAENYSGRDMLPRTWTFVVNWAGQFFRFYRGAARAYTAKDANDVDLDLTGIPVRNVMSKHGGLVIGKPAGVGRCYAPAGRCGCAEWEGGASAPSATITVDSGFETLDKVPPDMVQFVLIATGAMFEHRELASQDEATHQDWMPMYLLDSWRVIPLA